VDEHLASAAGNVERAELDEEREINRNERKYWKNDKMVRGLRFCDSKTCGCLIDRDFQGAMNIMACGLAKKEALFAHTN
jgi:hypothetical protein